MLGRSRWILEFLATDPTVRHSFLALDFQLQDSCGDAKAAVNSRDGFAVPEPASKIIDGCLSGGRMCFAHRPYFEQSTMGG